MTKTDELRRLLDEHDVAWESGTAGELITRWTSNGVDWFAVEYAEGLAVCMPIDITPEQVIAATAVRETCHDVGFAPYLFECSECGKVHLRNTAYVDMPNYCPNCGRQVVE